MRLLGIPAFFHGSAAALVEGGRELTSKLMLLFGSSVFALLILESAVRVLDIAPRPLDPLPIPSYQLSDDPALIYEYRPHYNPSDRPFDKWHKGFSINSAGFRDHEYTEKKQPGVYRIVVLGNSITAGNGVSRLDSIYAKQLERLLNGNGNASSCGKRGPIYEVLNMAVGGYQPMQEVETLKVKGLKYSPDIVILALGVNDFSLSMGRAVREQLHKENAGFLRSSGYDWFSILLRKSRLAFLIYSRLVVLFPPEGESSYDEWYKQNVLHSQTTVRSGLSLISDLQKTWKFSAYVVIIPDFRYPFHDYRSSQFHNLVLQSADGISGFTIADLLPQFSKVSDDARVFTLDGLHLNEYGHRVMAQILLPLIKSQADRDPPCAMEIDSSSG